MLGVFYTFLAAISFGINSATVRRGVVTGSVTQVVAVSMPIGFVIFVAVAAASGQLARIGEFTPSALMFFASAGVIHFVVGRYCGYRSIQAMGANLAGPVQQWSLLVSLTLAIGFLDERLDLLKIIGIALMVLGPSIIAGTRVRKAARAAAAVTAVAETLTPGRVAPAGGAPAKPAFKPRLAQGYTFGALCCLCWGSSPILVRAGLEGTGLPLAGGVVSYGAAVVAVGLILLLPRPRADAMAIKRSNLKWFYWIGITVCVSQIFMYLAMAIAPVIVVQPLMRISVVFGVLFAWMLNREHEVFDGSVLLAIGISLLGVVALTLDSAALMQWMAAPQWFAAPFNWHWPN